MGFDGTIRLSLACEAQGRLRAFGRRRQNPVDLGLKKLDMA